jgi:glycolate oxidase FAD binding subunit
MSSEQPVSLRPRDAADVAEILRDHPLPVEPMGLGSKRSIGRPVEADPLDLSALDGILDYEPEELIFTARSATPMPIVQEALDLEGQRLAFEPPDLGTLLGVTLPQTLGGVLAANLAGSRRVHAGAARDHFLGFRAVDGRGTSFKAGGKVVKNVTGYDLPKLLAGSWGTLAVLTEVTVRVAPAAEGERTVIVAAATPEEAVALMSGALSSPFDVSAAAYAADRGVMLRLEGFEASLASRVAGLVQALRVREADCLEDERSEALWRATGGAHALAEWPVVWRLSVPPSDAARVVRSLEPEGCLLDWGGGLIWAAYQAVEERRVRGVLREGHATLLKAPQAARAQNAVFQPQPPALAAMTARVKAAFDPANRLNPGRMT